MLSERQHRREMAIFGQMLHERGYVAATDGNLSVRLDDERILVTPTCMSKGMLRASDMVVVNLYRFEEVAAKAGVQNPQKAHGMGICWGDFDGDGWPDLYVTNDASSNFLFHNKRVGTFEDIGLDSGTAYGEMGQTYGNMACDLADLDHSGETR